LSDISSGVYSEHSRW